MTRVLVVAVLVGLFVGAKVAYDRRAARLAAVPVDDLPVVPAEMRGPGRTWLVFATEYCATCGPVAAALEHRYPGDTMRLLYVEEHGDLAATLDVRTAPTVFEVAPDGTIDRRLAGAAAATELQRSLA